ncbi:DUF6932 family protein [Methanosarcina sp. MTP4]|uniref:DUF6932 family protein n=1 Tax=Methanosarcina sp. MTP4 TaxID=1434100 RepID=UPI00064FB131|nr:hypothetical protein [Methanosarcina sp. MTP4]
MSAIPEFEDNGNLPLGFIKPKLTEFQMCFVNGFPESVTREKIFDGYIRYCSLLIPLNIATLQWVNGSYTTHKIDPNDIDFVTHISGIELDESYEEIKEDFNKIIDKEWAKSECKCDVYFIIIYPPELSELYEDMIKNIEYWSKWFTHDRKNNPKGIIEFDLSDSSFDIDSVGGIGSD